LSLDGRIATRTGHSQWITGAAARARAHLWRDRVDGILVGVETALADDPALTARPGRGKGHDPLRVVLDSRLRLPATARLLHADSTAPTLVFCGSSAPEASRRALTAAGAMVVEVGSDREGGLALGEVLDALGSQAVTTLLVEGGGRVHAAFLRQGLYDQARLFVAPLFLGADGVPVVGELGLTRVDEGKRFTLSRVQRLGNDIMIEGLFEE
jgi:diaminohydroxyphosphoribosylaminopyrimidine deaminase/5-amino-6-(5-phosphoribosylamino)uracil reductase